MTPCWKRYTTLHRARVGGQSLRSVAEGAGPWVALLICSGATPHTKARESQIGGTPRQRARRLGFVVNNSRFLILPERQRPPNLASRVWALGLQRLNADWQAHWGHPGPLGRQRKRRFGRRLSNARRTNAAREVSPVQTKQPCKMLPGEDFLFDQLGEFL